MEKFIIKFRDVNPEMNYQVYQEVSLAQTDDEDFAKWIVTSLTDTNKDLTGRLFYYEKKTCK